jgi:glucokinase
MSWLWKSWTLSAETLGLALATISCVVDPEVYVIGGGVSKAGEILTDAL